MQPRDLTLREIRQIGIARSARWHPQGASDWDLRDFAIGFGGEAGELLNAIKKLRRLETGAVQAKGPANREEALSAVVQEIGDTFLYLDLVAAKLGVDLQAAIAATFNRVSEREGFPDRMPMPGEAARADAGKAHSMATAPKDGTDILLLFEADPDTGDSRGSWGIGYWDNRRGAWMTEHHVGDPVGWLPLPEIPEIGK